jgi:hypothetical protein
MGPWAARAQSKLVIDTFDTADSIASWTATWGSSATLDFGTLDAAGSASSGSLKVSQDFAPANGAWQQLVITRTFDTPVTGSQYSSVSIDVKVDPSSVPTAAGQYGYFELKRTTDSTSMGGVNLTSTNWTTVTYKLAATEGTLPGIIIQNGSAGFVGPITLYLDNLVFNKAATNTPPPTLLLETNASPGLKLYASAPGQAYQRQNVVYAPTEDLGNQLWWVDQPDAVTYAVTWADFPDKNAYTGFQGHIMLVTDTSGAITPDWNDPNVVMVEFQYANTPGPDAKLGTADDVIMARARLLHKVNEAAGNAMLYRTQTNASQGPVGVLGELFAPSMIGTWSVSFKGNTNIILTAPDNSTTNLFMPLEDAALYVPTSKGVSALFGIQPNSVTGIERSAIISHIKITKGSQVVVDDTFQGATLDSAKWILRAQDPGGIFTITPDLAFLISWDLPDTGFSLRAGPTVKGPWTTAAAPLLVGARQVTLINKSALPSPKMGVFQLVKPAGQ